MAERGRSSARPTGLHEAVAATAAADPDRTALIVRDQSISYRELDTAASTVAAALAAEGVGPGSRVPILLPRSCDLIVVLLGVLKAGGAYALLDRAWPVGELAGVLDQLGAELAVAGPDQPLPDGVRRWDPTLPRQAAPFATVPSRPEDACCVYFTSGTTGRPKGAVVPHRATSRLFVKDSFAQFGPDTTIPLAAAPPWDAFSLELWGGLYNGGRCVVVEEPFLSPDALHSGVARHGVNTVWVTSSLFNMLVDEALDSFDGIRQVLIGGERLSPPHVRRFLERHPGVALVNGYGPVESTVFVSAHRVRRADCLRPGGIPLGICVPGTTVFVMDGDRECGRDEEGEICVAGEGLAIEYVGDPELTAQRFVTVELRGRPQRVYRTGDLGVWASPEGLLEFRGRADRQVKVRGVRIEPADVEAAVEAHSARVASCRVVARPAADGTTELVAFIVPTRRGDELAGLLDELAGQLPRHRLPGLVVPVTVFPLTDRGKIDEASLVAEVASAQGPLDPRAGAADGDPPTDQDPDVRVVAAAFGSVLGATVPHDVSFFALGGSSLAAGRLCARLATQTGRSIPVSQIYRSPTVAGLAGWLRDTTQPVEDSVERAAREAGDGRGEVPLTAQQLVFLTRDLVEPDGLTGHCLLTWRLQGQVNLEAMDQAVVETHERQPALRARYSFDPTPAAVVTQVDAPPLQVLRPAPDEATAIAELEAVLAEPFDLDAADVWRVALVPVGQSEVAYLGCSVHHIAFDGWSESVLAEEISRAYNVETAPPAAPPMALLARRRAARLAHADVPGQVIRLAESLTGLPPLSWPGGADRLPGVRTVCADLAPETVRLVDAVARRHRTTRFSCLLTGWAQTLAEVAGLADLAVGVPVSTRADPGDEQLVGCGVNTVPVRLATDPGASFPARLALIDAASQLALSCQDAPLSDLVEALRQPPAPAPSVIGMIVALQDNPAPRLRLNGLETRHLRRPYLDLPTELHLELWPTEADGLTVQLSTIPGRVPDQLAEKLLAGFLAAVATSTVCDQAG